MFDSDKRLSNKLNKVLSEAPRKFPVLMNKAMHDIAFEVQGRAVKNAPFKTGNLRSSIQAEATSEKAVIGTNLEYARIHDIGGVIPARIVRPKRAKALRFFVGGKAVFAKSVRMPQRKVRPYKGRGYLKPEFLKMKNGKAFKIIEKHLRRLYL